jgi:hypothetical protein
VLQRSSKQSWLEGPSDLREADVEDVPVPGESVRVRALSAAYSAEVQGQLKLVNEGREQIAKIDVPSMELLQFVHGVIDPVFTQDEAKQVQAKYGAAFRKVVAKIDELSGIDKETIDKTEKRFPAGGTGEARGDVGDGVANGSAGPDLHVRAGA